MKLKRVPTKTARIILCSLLTSNTAFAASTNHFGFGINNGTFNVKDPDGPTNDVNSSYLSAIMTMPVDRNNNTNRYWLEVNYRDITYAASTVNIGQSVTSLGLMGVYQHSFSVSELYRPWVGIGAAANFSDYSNRHTLDTGGFLATQYADRTATNIDLILNIGASLRKTEGGYYFGANIFSHHSLDNGLNGINVQAFMLF